MQVLTLINEPTAAAICYGLNAQDDQTVLVYDFGGGTLDVTILRIHHGIFEEISSKGIGKLGGDDLDAALGNVLAERFQEKTGFDILNSPYKQQFMLAVEKAKIDLSTEQTAVARKAELVPERHLEPGRRDRPGDVRAEIMPLVVKSGTAIDEALKLRGMRPQGHRQRAAGRRHQQDPAGPPLRRREAGRQGAGAVRPRRSDDLRGPGGGHRVGHPARGARPRQLRLQRQAGAFAVRQPGRSANANRVFLDPIIKRGADIPCSFTKTYYPVADPAERVLISVYEGDVYDNPESPENVKLAEIPWEFKPPRPQRDGALEVTFEYGDDGILTVQIHDPYAGQKKRFAIQQAGEDQMDAVADHQDEAHQRGPDQPHDGAGIDAGIQGRRRSAEEDRAGRDPEGREPGGPPRAGGPVPAGARGDGHRATEEDGGGRPPR